MPLINPDEPRYASTARDMILNGNWIVPHFNGVPRINKPPLFYRAVAISYKIFGINEFGARLPSALAAAGTVLITYLWGKRIEDRKNGFWAGMVLWPALFISVMIPIALIFTMHKWVPAKHGLSTIHIAIPIVILFVGTLIALFTFVSSKRFFQLKKVLCLTNCLFLIITITYSAKYLGTFRSTKDIVKKCLQTKERIMCSSVMPELCRVSCFIANHSWPCSRLLHHTISEKI